MSWLLSVVKGDEDEWKIANSDVKRVSSTFFDRKARRFILRIIAVSERMVPLQLVIFSGF